MLAKYMLQSIIVITIKKIECSLPSVSTRVRIVNDRNWKQMPKIYLIRMRHFREVDAAYVSE